MGKLTAVFGLGLITPLLVLGCTREVISVTPPSAEATGISVTGEGRVAVEPDQVLLTLGIESQEATVELARQRAAEAMDRVLAALKAQGVAERDIQTRRLSIAPVERADRDGRLRREGYRVTNNVLARLRTVDRAGAVVDAVAAAGGDLTRVQGIQFTIENPESAREQAREKAMVDARARAQQVARGMGVSLGPLRHFSEGAVSIPRPLTLQVREAAAAPQTPISAGEQEVVVTVSVVYAIG